jgi:hypothetical protein
MKTTELENKSRRPHNFRQSKVITYEVRKEFEFETESIQVDGGSEFMGEFEECCE